MLVQTDVTPRVELENKLADLTDAQVRGKVSGLNFMLRMSLGPIRPLHSTHPHTPALTPPPCIQLSMLEELFPRHIIEHMLARDPGSRGTKERNLKGLANMHDKVMVLFCDVVGFTTMSKDVEASEVGAGWWMC